MTLTWASADMSTAVIETMSSPTPPLSLQFLLLPSFAII